MMTQLAEATDAKMLVDARNSRIRLVDCGRNPAEAAEEAKRMSEQHGCDKIWGFVSPEAWNHLARAGFRREGTLAGFFPDRPGIAVARFLSNDRAHSPHIEREDGIIEKAMERRDAENSSLPDGYFARMATRGDAGAISRVLTTVFDTYPTPIGSADAILRAMSNDVHFALILHGGKIAGVASADIDRAHRVAEMTDCAVLPDYRGHGLMGALLDGLAREIRALGLRSLFTLARATSAPMNITFARLGYDYSGRLLNNCHIAGDWEDMNLWVKPLKTTERLTTPLREV